MHSRRKIAVLLVHCRYQERGGEDVVFDAETELLKEHGHPVDCLVFDNHDIPDRRSPFASANLAVSTVWSKPAAARVSAAIREFTPEVVHFHNTFPLITPSAYAACRKSSVPVVQTLHNYRLLCPNAQFFRDGHACEDCLGRTPPWPGVWHGCYRNSRGQTAAVAAMLTVHRLRRTWERDVDVYVALTDFARRKLAEGGVPADKIVVTPNFLHPDPGMGAHRGDFALFVGRLTPSKGVETLLRTWESFQGLPPLRIIGEGPLSDAVARAGQLTPAIEFRGHLDRDSVLACMGQARVLIFPSQWYEAFPMSIVEALATGLPIIASRLGAMAEIIEDGRTGLHFATGDSADLAARVRWAWEHPDMMRAMGKEGRRVYETKYTAEHHYQQLMQIYQRAMGVAAGRSS